MAAGIDVVVVSFNCRDTLLECCSSIIEAASSDAAAASPRPRLIVVDSASEDGSADAVRAQFPMATVIERNHNDGFATAVNAGLRTGEADHVLLLNPDARLVGDALAILSRLLGEDPDTGAVGPRIESPDGVIELSRGRTLTPLNEIAFKLAGWLYREGRGPLAPWVRRSYSRRRETRSLTAACLLVRRNAVERLGGLDERFFLYAEDVDLCMRLRREGWRLLYAPEATAVHARGTSASGDAGASERAYRRSQLSFYRKHNGRPATAFLRMWLGARYAARAVVTRGPRRVEAVRMLRWCLRPNHG